MTKERCAQSLRHHLRKQVAGKLSAELIDERTSKTKNWAIETVEKQNCVFPPFPQALLLLTNQYEKQRPENNRRSLHKILEATATMSPASMPPYFDFHLLQVASLT